MKKAVMSSLFALLTGALPAATEWVDGIRWNYTASNGEVQIYNGSESAAIDKDTSGAITIPSFLDGKPVTGIGDYAFYQCTEFTSVTIPNSVTGIGDHAFDYCPFLPSVTIPDSVTYIGNYAFQNCSYLKSVTIGNSVTRIGKYAFYYCDNKLTSVTIPDSVTSIGDGAFQNCFCLTSVSIGNSVTSIGEQAFYDCIGLENVVMKGDCPEVGHNAFDKVAARCVVHLPAGNATYTVIDGKWQGMKVEYYYAEPEFTIDDNGVLTKVELNSATEIALPDGVTKVSASAFHGCRKLASVAIPDGVDEIPMSAFDGCETLWAKWFRTLERMSNEGATTANDVVLTVTNVVVHYVTQSVPSAAVTPSADVGFVNVISEVSAGAAVAIPSEWAAQYGEAFTAKFGNDFTAAITKQTGKKDSAGNAMYVWQDFVAGTDPTDEDDVFRADITFGADGKPVISHTPELSEAEAAKRKYTTFGKVKLNDKDWTEVAPGEEDGYNFFKVTVEMR